MPLSTFEKNALLEHMVANDISHISLHDDDPAGGANEVSGGGYARLAVDETDWDAAAAGEIALSDDHQFATPALQPVHSVGLWDAGTGGNFLGSGAVTGDGAANSSGEYVAKAGSKIRLTDS
jgi:hypothetical protein